MTQMLFCFSAMQLDLHSNVNSLLKAGFCVFSIRSNIHLQQFRHADVWHTGEKQQHLYEMCALAFRAGVHLHFEEGLYEREYICLYIW